MMKSVRGCPDCGQLNQLLRADAGTIVTCCRCGRTLRRVHRNSLEKVLCFALAGLTFYLLLAFSPLLDVSLFGRGRSNTIDTGPSVFSDQQLWFLGALVVVTTIAMPFIKLVLTLAVMTGLRLKEPPHILADCFRWAKEVTKWSMLEVYLLGFLVAYTRLHALVIIHIDVAVYALVGTILTSTAMDAVLDSEAVWDEMEGKGIISPALEESGEKLLGCEVCHAVGRRKLHAHCHRCGAKLHGRKPNSLSRTWALAIGAIIFYVPANYFPVMVITRIGQTTDHTIIDGMLEFVKAGLWPLALLVFIASIAIPMLKLITLGFMLIETHRGSATGLLLRTKLYRLVEFIGRWSMVDVFMLSVLIGLIRFGQMIEIRPGLGAPCFAAVVVLTMLAVDSFDARLMWDAAGRKASSKSVTTRAMAA